MEVNPIANYIPFTEEQREQARQTDLVAFLRQCGEIVKPSGSEFQWNNDGQKITIRGNVWYNQYEQFGGDAISFAQHFYDYSYQDAVCLIPASVVEHYTQAYAITQPTVAI